MEFILTIVGALIAYGTYNILIFVFDLPTKQTTKVVLAIEKKQKKKVSGTEVLINDIAQRLAKYIRLNPYKRRQLQTKLQSIGLRETPEMYRAKSMTQALLILAIGLIVYFISPFVTIIMVIIAVFSYLKAEGRADEQLASARKAIEYELPRFVSTLKEELKASRNIMAILETYQKTAGIELAQELEITLADMKSGSYESALTRFESRINSSMLSEVVRGLVGCLRGDDGGVYFQMLSHDMKQVELQRLKKDVLKIPKKIERYSLLLLGCFVFIFIVVMMMDIVRSAQNLF